MLGFQLRYKTRQYFLRQRTKYYALKKHLREVSIVFYWDCLLLPPYHLLFFRALVTFLTRKANAQSTNAYHTWISIVCTNHKRKGRLYLIFRWEKSLLAPSFEPVTFCPRYSSTCSHTFLSGFGHFHGFTRSGPSKNLSGLLPHKSFDPSTTYLHPREFLRSLSTIRGLLISDCPGYQ